MRKPPGMVPGRVKPSLSQGWRAPALVATTAFYSVGCDSRALFEGLEVSRREGWDRNLNAYNVLHLDMAEAIQAATNADAVAAVTEAVLPEPSGQDR